MNYPRSKLPAAVAALSAAVIAAHAQTLYTSGGTVGSITGNNVGIGSWSPAAKLDVAGGDIVVRDVAGQPGYSIKSYLNADSLWLIPSNAGNPKFVLGVGIAGICK